MSDQEPISVSQFLARLLPPDEQAQLDDESDTSLIKIPTLFYVANYLFVTYQSTEIVEILDKAINYAEQLKRLLAALQPQLKHEPTTATAAGFLMMLLERKSNQQSDRDHFERLLEAAKDHLRLTEPETPVETLGTLAHASIQLYYRTHDSAILARAIQRTRDYLSVIESDHDSAAENQSGFEHPSGVAHAPISDELRFGTRRNLVKCLAEQHWSERDADSLYDLINECARSLQLIPIAAKEHDSVQEIMNFAVMAWYFRRLAPQWDMQGLFSGSTNGKVHIDAPKPPDMGAAKTLQHSTSPLGIRDDVYVKHRLRQGVKEIRLLELLPDSEGSLLVCKLNVVDLQKKPTYDALSYVWGDSKDTRQIKVDHSIQNVTTNLFRALSRLRKRDQSLLLWVDAICINQKDDIEKLHQIDLMREVYSSAREVIMWLGEPDAGDTTPSQKIQAPLETLADMKSHWPPWIYHALKPYLDEEHLSESERDQSESYLGDDLQFRQIIEQLPSEVRPIFYAPPVTDLGVMDRNSQESRTLVITTLLTESFNAINDFADLLQQNSFSREQDGLKMEVFDWRRSAEVPQFFIGPQDPREWPILGAFSIAYFLATSKHLTDIPFFAKDESIVRCLSQAWLKSVNALQNLLDNAYWMRAWITQEIVLAQNPVIYYGRHIMGFKMLATAQAVFKQHSNGRCCASALQERTLKACHGTPIWTALGTSFARIEDCTEMWLRNAHARAQGEEVDTPWSHILSFNLTRRYAAKPLDHVYGILGLVANNGPEKISADYSASVAAVYAKATERVIKTSNNLKVFATFTAARLNHFQLPSWVLDWSTGWSDIGLGYPWKPRTLDGKASSVCFYDDLCLALRSNCVDVASLINVQIEDCTDCSLDGRAKVISSWRQMAGLTDEVDTSAPREAEFWSTLFADHLLNVHTILDRKQMMPDDVGRAQKWWQWICKEGHSPEKTVFGGKEFFRAPSTLERDDDVDRMIHALTRRKTFFITASGRLATARGPIAEGDEIHLVEGCGFPLILRRAQKTSDSANPSASSSPSKAPLPSGKQNDDHDFLDLSKCTHDAQSVVHYIGDAYVHGITSTGAIREAQSPPETIFIR